MKKATFGQNDILGCVDTIAYSPDRIYLDQTTDIRHISVKRHDFENTLKECPKTESIIITIHGLEGYRHKDEDTWNPVFYRRKLKDTWNPVFTRYVTETWIDGEWVRNEVFDL